MALHDTLKDARNRVGMSQELVAEQLGISRQAVTKWELGQSKPSAKNLKALADLYQIPAEELLIDMQKKGPNLILRTNLTRIAIAAQTVFLYSCTHVIIQLRHCVDTDKYLYQGEFIFFLVLLTLSSIWVTTNHRYLRSLYFVCQSQIYEPQTDKINFHTVSLRQNGVII